MKENYIQNLKDSDWVWLLESGQDVDSSVRKILNTFHCLSDRAKHEFRQRNTSGSEMRELSKNLVNSAIIAKDGKIIRNANYSKNQKAFLLYQQGNASRFLDQYSTVKIMAIVSLLDASIYAIKSENFLLLMMSLRGVMEHIGNFELTRKTLNIDKIPEKFDEALELLVEIQENLAIAVGGTRVHWSKLSLNELPETLTKKFVAYEPEEMGTNLSATQVLNGIDLLDKKVKGTRAVYEISCEFCHPNVGAMFAFCHSAQPFKDERYEFTWVEKELRLGSPAAFLRDCGRPISKSLEIFAACLDRLEDIQKEIEKAGDSLRTLTQRVVRHMITNGSDMIWSYSDCPCGSEKKVRFCCGSKSDNS